MATLTPYEGPLDFEEGRPETPPTARVTVRPRGLSPYEGEDIPPDRPARPDVPAARAYPQGLEGSVKAQMSGQLHGLTSVLGAPGDILSWGARQAGIGDYAEPFLPTSRWMRKILDLPGRALGLEGHATYNDINEVPETYRAQARAGEAIGSGVPFLGGLSIAARGVPAALHAARTVTPSATRNILRSQVGAAAAPGFAASQLPAAVGAGAGAYGAETFFPGSDAAQMFGQLGGGLVGAGTVAGVSAGANRLINRIKEPISTLHPEGARGAIARSLAPHFEKHGEDVSDIIGRLSADESIPGALPAERSGSRVLMGVQENLAKTDPALANEIAARQQGFRQNIEAGVREGFEPGEQAALTGAARQYDEYIGGLVNRAEEEARAAASAMSVVGPAERETLNVRARNAVEGALAQARQQERQLWNDVPNDLPVNPRNVINEYDAVRAQLLEEERLPNIIENAVERMREGPMVPFREVHRLRTLLLNEATKARAADDVDAARIFNQIANGDPRAGGMGGALADMSDVGDPAVRMAREFSALLNDRFSRSFAGDILGMSAEGAPAVRPGLTLERTFSGRPAVQAQQARELRESTAPVGYGPPRPTADPTSEIGQVQEEFLRTQTQKFVSPDTGRVNPAAAQRWARDNAQVLDQFPAYRDQIDRAVTSELAAQQLAGGTADAAKQEVFARLIQSGEKPAIAVGAAITGANPVRDFQELSRLANRAGPDAVAGLRASVLSFVADRTSGPNGMSFRAAQDALTKPVRPGGPSLLDMMQNNRVITPVQRRDITDRLAIGLRHETAPERAVRIDEVGNEAGKIARWGARIMGAKLASFMGATGGGAGPSLQVANIAASAAEQALAKSPVGKAQEIISRAMQAETPDELIAILEKISTPKVTLRRGLRQPELISIIRPLFPRTESRPNLRELPAAAQSVVRGLQLGP